jgi:penicillin amidase
VIIGHNARIAWGVTNVEPDTQDLYIIKVDPTDDTKYELDGQMRDMQVLTESIKIGGQAEPFDLRVRLTRWGPIISETRVARDDSRGEERVLALRWSASEQPNRLIDAALAINRATDWDSFRAALRLWDAPSQNFVYADIDGNIGYQMPGRVTIRANGHSGLTPVDGSTSAYDWKGYLPFEYLPSVYNPQKGYIQTANQAVVPASYYEGLASVLGDQFGADSNYAFTLSWWSAGFRGKRINALIEANSQHTVESLGQIQGDNYNSLAAILLPAALSVLGSVPDVPASVTTWLGEWTDYQNDLSKGQPALFEAFWLELVKRLWGDDLGYTPDSSLLFLALDVLLDAPDHGWWDDSTTTTVRESRDDILKAAYAAAYKLVAQRLGTDDHTRWTWGALHTATFRSNPLGQSGIGPLESFVNGGPVAASGGTEIVNATRYRLSDPFVVRSVPSMRMVIDLSNLDASVWINATGQSGHPMSDQYRDQIERWRLIQFLPMRASRSAIEGATTSRLDLVPK